MSQFYNPRRSADWNYGGPKWRLSRSKLDLFLECPRCFYLDNRLGVGRPKGFPFNLNSAVDKLLKKEFDVHRAAASPHPLMRAYGVDAVPFQHHMMSTWRENFKGIDFQHPATGMTISGAVDDVWINQAGELIIVDYKSTSKDEEVNIDAAWQIAYKRQMEVYQWLFRQNGFKVSPTGYFVYCNGNSDAAAFDARLEFDIKLIPYVGNDAWVEPAIVAAHVCLNAEKIPKPGPNCDYCRYRQAVRAVAKSA